MAAAIASIAFGEPVAAVDGNVTRVLSRLLMIGGDIRSARARRRIEEAAGQLLSPSRPGDFNQAWMDLGSAVCTPRTPDCPRCPLRLVCRARAAGAVLRYPQRTPRRDVPREVHVVGLFHRSGRVLVRRRPDEGRWSGLWELPNAPADPRENPTRQLQCLAREHRVGRVQSPVRLGSVRRRLTHRELVFEVYRIETNGTAGPSLRSSTGTRWVTPAGFAALGVSTAHRRIWRLHEAFDMCGD
jgi:A/G-specific adenine glycosylase